MWGVGAEFGERGTKYRLGHFYCALLEFEYQCRILSQRGRFRLVSAGGQFVAGGAEDTSAG